MPRSKSRTDDDVLEAAGRVLLERGPHAFTLAHVAEEAGLSAPTLIQRFRSKRGLLVAFARWASKEPQRAFANPRGLRALTNLRTSLVRQVESLGDRRRMANSLALLLEDVRDEELRAAAKAHAEAMEEAIAEQLRTAVREGELKVSHPSSLAKAVHTTYSGALIQWALRGDGGPGKWVGDAIDQVLEPYRSRPRARRL